MSDLDHALAEADRLLALDDGGYTSDWERLMPQYRDARPTEKRKQPAPVSKAVETGPRIERSLSEDGTERVWIPGWPKYKYLIHGVANTARINSHGCSQLPRGAIFSLPIPVLWKHAEYGGPIGEVCYLQRDARQIYIRARIFEHEAGMHAWQKVVLGEVTGLSMAADNNDPSLHVQAVAGDARFYDRWKVKEVSIVDTPANKDCWFKIYPHRMRARDG